MKNRDILLLAGLGVIAYFLLRKRGSMTVKDLQADKPSPVAVKVEEKSPIAGPANQKNPVLIEDIKVERKEPIYMPAQNAIPNVYDRGVGQPVDVASNGERYYNMSGTCSENVQKACKCSVNDKTKYKLDIPTLP